MKSILLSLLTILFITPCSFAQEDAEGCHDHPFFTRLSNFNIEACSESYISVNMHTSASAIIAKEGNTVKLHYLFNEGSGARMPSPLQVLKNYENAIRSKGGKTVFLNGNNEEGEYTGGTFSMSKDGKEYWVMVDNMSPGLPTVCDGYDLYVVEMEPMNQEITANAMFDEINKSGFIALSINFETGKSRILPDSEPIVEQIVQLLKTNAGLRISIEGHTDNTGTPAGNKRLSADRAKAVMAALVSKGIAASRLQAAGYGQERPVADNATDAGKAKNRRVEIRKL